MTEHDPIPDATPAPYGPIGDPGQRAEPGANDGPIQHGPVTEPDQPAGPLRNDQPMLPAQPGPSDRRAVRAFVALALVGAGLGVGVGVGRSSGGNSLAISVPGQSTSEVDPGTGGSAATGSATTGSGSTGTGTGSPSTGSGTGSGSTGSGTSGPGGGTSGGGTTGGGTTGWGWGSGRGGGGVGAGGGAASTADVSTPASAAQQVGVVDINTVLNYQGAAAAGTGMVLTSRGVILTNNHVVNGATRIQVTLVSTGKTYTAAVVGTDATDDIAVLQLKSASGLPTAKISTTATVAVGDKVTGVGNAGGAGGTPSAASGRVTALNQSITASDEGGSNAQKLTGLIENNANILAGDSGGPLYDAGGSIIGINTAGASTNQYSANDQSYAITITKALGIAGKIRNGDASSTIHIGSTAFLGVSVSTTAATRGPLIGGVVAAGPAARAGIVAGDVITAIGAAPVTSATSLRTVMDAHHGGDKVVVKWTTATGASRHATITTIDGPAG